MIEREKQRGMITVVRYLKEWMPVKIAVIGFIYKH